jgi:fatty-acyl-CoA synthase
MKTFSESLLLSSNECPEKEIIYLIKSGIPDQKITFSELIKGSANYTHELVQRGIQPGDVIILVLQHGIDLIQAYFGCILHGAIPSIMPFLTEKLIPERYRVDLASLIKITKPSAIITYGEFENEIKSAVDPASSVKEVIIVEKIISRSLSPVFYGLERKSSDIVLLQHSSGTTGLQKGVALSHQAVYNQLASYQKAIKLTSLDVIVSWLPLYHDMGLIACFLMPILLRIPLVLMSPFEWVRAPYKLFSLLSTYNGTLCWLPNFAYNFCADKIREYQLEQVKLDSVRAVINCSEPVRWDSHQKFLAKFEKYGLKQNALAACYAMAENVFAVTQGGIEHELTIDEIDLDDFQRLHKATQAANKPSIKMVSNGKPIDNTLVNIISEKGMVLSERNVGQIAIKSTCMLSEYYHRPEDTKKSMLDGWFLTGDLGYLANDELYISGRIKDMIIVGGKNIYPQDIEYISMKIEGVHQGRVVAFGVFNEKLGTEEVVVVAEMEPENNSNKAQISEQIKKVVAQNSAITLKNAYIVQPKWLIKTSSGKIARNANRDKYLKEVNEAG